MLLGQKRHAKLPKLSSAISASVSSVICNIFNSVWRQRGHACSVPWCIGHVSSVTSAYSGDHWLPTAYAWTWEICTGQGSVHKHTFLAHIYHGNINNGTREQKMDDRVGAWSEFNTDDSEDLETGRSTGCNKVPVGVFEAYASLFEFIGVLQFGHVLDIHRRLGHGLLEKSRQGKKNKWESVKPHLESDLAATAACEAASWTSVSYSLGVWMKTRESLVSWMWVHSAAGSQHVCCWLPASISAAAGYDCPFALTISQLEPRAETVTGW